MNARFCLLSGFILAATTLKCVAQDAGVTGLNSPLLGTTGNAPLSKTLLDVADKAHINIVADTTTQSTDIEARKPLVTPSSKTVGQFLSEQGPVYGYYWTPTNENTVLVWPKPDTVAIARQLTAQWQQHSVQTELSADIKNYFDEVARRNDEEGGAEKKNKSIYYNVRPQQLSEETRTLLLPLIIKAMRQYSVEHSQSWLGDDFWKKAQVSIAHFDNKDWWYVSSKLSVGRSSGRGLASPMPEGTSYVPWGKTFVPDEQALQKAGTRGTPQMPTALAKTISLKVENTSIVDALSQLSKLCGYTIRLNEATSALVKDKRVTLDVTDVPTSALLHDLALLFDFQWTQQADALVALPNTDDAQNVAAKIGCDACLTSWKSFAVATHANWNDLFPQEITLSQAKKGVPLSDFSPELQKTLRDYCQEEEASDVLNVWLQTEGTSSKNLRFGWRMSAPKYQRNAAPMPAHELTAEEANDPQFMGALYAKYYIYGRPYTVTIGEDGFHYDFVLPLERPSKTVQTP